MKYNLIVDAIRISGLTHSDKIPSEHHDKLYLPIDELNQLLNNSLVGLSLRGMALRTRSKFLNEKICEMLGYIKPESFKKTKPRFLGQNLDKYIQKSNNLQIWNAGFYEEVQRK